MWRIEGRQWTTLHELLAINAELTDQWGLFGARLRVKHPEKLPKESLRIHRPGEVVAGQKDEVITDPAEIARWFS